VIGVSGHRRKRKVQAVVKVTGSDDFRGPDLSPYHDLDFQIAKVLPGHIE
jgi:hypothetical protein